MASPAAQPPVSPASPLSPISPGAGAAAHPQRPLPPVELVRPGLWSIPVPLPNTSLRYVLVYVFETPAGPYLVDAGWDNDEAYDALSAGLVTVGSRIEDVRGVLVTHVHPDHYGLAHRVREASGAWVSLHPADAAVIPQFEGSEPSPAFYGMLRRAGAPTSAIDEQRTALRMLASRKIPRPDLLIEDGDEPDVPGWALTSIWTPGHTPGHLCFWEPRHRLLLSGDHVLPRITPNVPPPADEDGDTLGDFLDSLGRLAERDALEVLPAHEHRFTDLGGRLAQLAGHHERRFAEVLTALAEGCEVAWDVAERMSWSRPWQQMDLLARRAAVGEAFAHLRALARRGLVIEKSGETVRWSPADGSGSRA